MKYGDDFLGIVNEDYLKSTKSSANLLSILQDLHILKEIGTDRFNRGYRDMYDLSKKINDNEIGEFYTDFFYKLNHWNMCVEEHIDGLEYEIKNLDLFIK